MIAQHAPTDRAVAAIAGLAEDYLELTGRVHTTRAIQYRERVAGSRSDQTKAPASIEVIRRMSLVEKFAIGAYRDGLRSLGQRTPDRIRGLVLAAATVARLRWLADNLVAIDAADTSTAGKIAGDAWRTVRGLGPDAREGGRAFPLESPCPRCGMPSLWADPVSWAVACGSPDCGSWFAPESVDRLLAPG